MTMRSFDFETINPERQTKENLGGNISTFGTISSTFLMNGSDILQIQSSGAYKG